MLRMRCSRRRRGEGVGSLRAVVGTAALLAEAFHRPSSSLISATRLSTAGVMVNGGVYGLTISAAVPR